MKDILFLALSSLISSGVIGLIFRSALLNKFEKRLADHNQELSKKLQKYSLYEQEKHEVYRTYYKILMKSQSSARIVIDENKGRGSDIVLMENDLIKLNDYMYSNALYFSDDISKSADDILELIKDVVIKKAKLNNHEIESKNIKGTIDEISKKIIEISEKVENIRMQLRDELTN